MFSLKRFFHSLNRYDRDWKKIEKYLGTKNVIQVRLSLISQYILVMMKPNHSCIPLRKIQQIRSHAQKYFIKVQRNNTGEKIPPPRPKKKSGAPKQQNLHMLSQMANHKPFSPSFATPPPTMVNAKLSDIPTTIRINGPSSGDEENDEDVDVDVDELSGTEPSPQQSQNTSLENLSEQHSKERLR